MTTITTTITTPAPMTLVKVERVQTFVSVVDVKADAIMRSRIIANSPVWPGLGENGDRHVPIKANPGGAYLGSF